MKKVIIEKIPEKTISLDKVSTDKFYAIIKDGERMPVTRKANYIALCEYNFTEGNCYSLSDTTSLIKYLESVLKYNIEVYEFDTIKEMYKFLSE